MLSAKELLYIEETAFSISEWTNSHRQCLHRIPETAWQEHKTTEYLIREMKQLGYRIVAGNSAAGHQTGLVAELGDDSSIITVLRFDIDALAVAESNEYCHRPFIEGFRSEHPEAMHACGHDGHMAIGLTVARILSVQRINLKGTVRFLFQPAEEGCMGAIELVKHGWLKDADYFLAGHIVGREYGYTPSGSADCVTGVNGSLATTKINAVFRGKSCHGACPENGASAISALCSAVLTLNGIPRNSVGSTRINIGRIEGGEGRNIVAEHASMELEVRGETTELNQYMEDRSLKILQCSAELYGCSSDISILGKAPSLVSSDDFHRRINTLLRGLSHTSVKEEGERFRASEDAALLMEEVKSHGGQAAFMLFCTDTTAPLHSSRYDFDPSILSKAASVLSCVVLDLHY